MKILKLFLIVIVFLNGPFDEVSAMEEKPRNKELLKEELPKDPISNNLKTALEAAKKEGLLDQALWDVDLAAEVIKDHMKENTQQYTALGVALAKEYNDTANSLGTTIKELKNVVKPDQVTDKAEANVLFSKADNITDYMKRLKSLVTDLQILSRYDATYDKAKAENIKLPDIDELFKKWGVGITELAKAAGISIGVL